MIGHESGDLRDRSEACRAPGVNEKNGKVCRVQDLWVLSLPTLIVLKLTGVIAWSWWWVLSPLWISGILIAPVLCALLVLLAQHMFRRAASSEELAAERYRMELGEGYSPAVMVGKSDVPDRLSTVSLSCKSWASFLPLP
jgi:hypothetical protein